MENTHDKVLEKLICESSIMVALQPRSLAPKGGTQQYVDSWRQYQARRCIDLYAQGREEVAITYTVTVATRRQWATLVNQGAGPTKECFGSTRKVKNGARSRQEDLISKSNFKNSNSNSKLKLTPNHELQKQLNRSCCLRYAPTIEKPFLD